MVDIEESQLDAVFRALGDPTRRVMLRRLAQGELTVGQLAEPLHMSLAAASKHIKALESAGLIAREVQGRTHVCRLDAGPLRGADAWLRHYERFWTTRLDRLEALLRQEPPTHPSPPATPATPATPAEPPASTPAPGRLAPSHPPRKRSPR